MPRQYTPRIPKTCRNCGIAFQVPPSLERIQCCSQSCSATLRLRTYKIPHGHSHGEATKAVKTVEYTTWCTMKYRCLNPRSQRWHRYGGRGITVCDAWINSYETFLADVGRRPSCHHSLDRIDNDGGYFPGNVKWSTAKQQNQNKPGLRKLTFEGNTFCIAEWARLLDIPENTIRGRLNKGYSADQALLPSLLFKRA